MDKDLLFAAFFSGRTKENKIVSKQPASKQARGGSCEQVSCGTPCHGILQVPKM